ncbi:hypothetical protein [Pseudarthrobacter sp. NIBRBAC000502771]|uniref:hypothetical protein n=1 Tax=Pseudarthrobacter sp. NIBRBAC000502771 TaxID=2590774 RepID=UPI00143D529F|nr:hypothetical protein [Pseudarthrobacter sp. NIBRBAC000502771]
MTEQEEFQSRSWEPAARHYRDLTEDEKATYRPREWEPRVEYFGRLQVHQPAKPRKAA